MIELLSNSNCIKYCWHGGYKILETQVSNLQNESLKLLEIVLHGKDKLKLLNS